MGMDSLMATDMRNRLQSTLSISLPVTLIFDHPSAEAIVDYILNEALKLELPKDPEASIQQREDEQRRSAVLNEISRLSEDEVAKSIADELAAIQEGNSVE
jgi:hypothetical protein